MSYMDLEMGIVFSQPLSNEHEVFIGCFTLTTKSCKEITFSFSDTSCTLFEDDPTYVAADLQGFDIEEHPDATELTLDDIRNAKSLAIEDIWADRYDMREPFMPPNSETVHAAAVTRMVFIDDTGSAASMDADVLKSASEKLRREWRTL